MVTLCYVNFASIANERQRHCVTYRWVTTQGISAATLTFSFIKSVTPEPVSSKGTQPKGLREKGERGLPWHCQYQDHRLQKNITKTKNKKIIPSNIAREGCPSLRRTDLPSWLPLTIPPPPMNPTASLLALANSALTLRGTEALQVTRRPQ